MPFRAVPREGFLPGVPVDEAYADGPVYTKADGGGTRISAVRTQLLTGRLHRLDLMRVSRQIATLNQILTAGANR